MGYTFISFVGQQNLGVQNPLEACLQAKNSDNTSKFDIDKIILMLIFGCCKLSKM